MSASPAWSTISWACASSLRAPFPSPPATPSTVLPACIVGSGVAGALSMAFGCALPAPHGGIFVFPVMTNVGGYLVALVVGSLVGMVLLGILKKKKV